jgi:hypothetical protein
MKAKIASLATAMCLTMFLPAAFAADKKGNSDLSATINSAMGFAATDASLVKKGVLQVAFSRTQIEVDEKKGETYMLCLGDAPAGCQDCYVRWHHDLMAEAMRQGSIFSNGFTAMGGGGAEIAMGQSMQANATKPEPVVDEEIFGKEFLPSQRVEAQALRVFAQQ